jgi:hypothetical protein
MLRLPKEFYVKICHPQYVDVVAHRNITSLEDSHLETGISFASGYMDL